MRNNFYCQKKCGEVDFSIDEWNKAQEEIKQLKLEREDFMLEAETICQEQCSSCSKIVTERRAKTQELINNK